MEIYFKDLTSERTPVDCLVDDLLRVVHGIDDLASATGGKIPAHFKHELIARLEGWKASLSEAKRQAVAGVRATGRVIESKPYASMAVAFSLGVLAAILITGKRGTS